MSSSLDTEYSALVGSVINNKYVVERLLGAGGMGLVFLAQHIDLARPVAVKLIRRELMETDSVAERFLREARAAARIQNEHVGRVLDVGRLGTGEPYIVMEYLEGRDLAQHLASQRLDPEEAVDLLLEASEAVAEAHQLRIVHRDLKPENLFLAEKPDGTVTIKVLDFGISKQLGETEQRVLTMESTTLGSPQYMAPEQMEGAHVDVRADIWALGAILYEMISGCRAFDGETLAQVCVQVLSGRFVPLQELVPDISLDLAQAVAQCLRPTPDERFASVAAMANALAPSGTGRARVSANRIASVLGMRAGDPASRNSFAPPSKLSTPVNALQRTEVGAPSDKTSTSAVVPASSRTVGVSGSPRRKPLYFGLLGLVLAGTAVWALGARSTQDEDAQVPAIQAMTSMGAVATAAAMDPVSTASLSAPAAVTLTSTATATPAGSATSEAAEEAPPPVASPPRNPSSAPRAVTRSAAPAVRAPVALQAAVPATDAKPAATPSSSPKGGRFQRDSFGGRR